MLFIFTQISIPYLEGSEKPFIFASLFKELAGGVAELVDCTGLENRRAGNRTGGSNPSSSAWTLE